MKKIAMIAAVAMIAGAVSADLSVNWRSQAGAVTESDGGSDYLVGVRIDLIWSATGAITTAGQYDVTLGTETVLATDVTGANSLWSGLGGIYAGDYTGGLFFTRVYQNTGAAGEYFLDIAMGDGANFVYNSQDTATTFDANVVSGVQWVGDNGTQVIPEPATVGLFGLGALSAWIVRRNKVKAREEA